MAIKDDIDCSPYPSKGKQMLVSDFVRVFKEKHLRLSLGDDRWIYMDARGTHC